MKQHEIDMLADALLKSKPNSDHGDKYYAAQVVWIATVDNVCDALIRINDWSFASCVEANFRRRCGYLP